MTQMNPSDYIMGKPKTKTKPKSNDDSKTWTKEDYEKAAKIVHSEIKKYSTAHNLIITKQDYDRIIAIKPGR